MSKLLVDTQDFKRKRKMTKNTSMGSFREPDVEGIPGINKLHGESVDAIDTQILNAMNIKKDEIPNIENQRLFRNLGVQEIVMQILKLNSHKNQYKTQDYTDL